METSEIKLLADLLKVGPIDSDSDIEDDQKSKKSQLRPSDIGKPKIIKNEEKKKEKSDTKLDYDNLEKFENEISSCDWKKKPEWDLVYKQSVTPEDVFLQIGQKTQLTSSCEEMIITINLPGENGNSIDVKLTQNELDMSSAQFHLCIPLPHPVDPKQGNAKWDSEKQHLKLTLVMIREFDFINF